MSSVEAGTEDVVADILDFYLLDVCTEKAESSILIK